MPGFSPGVTGCRQPPELPACVGLHQERGASCCPSILLSLLKLPPALCPHPRFSPGRVPRGPAPPGLGCGCGTGLQRRSVRVGVSLKPCSYGAAPHRDQRLSHATVIPAVAGTGNKQGQNTDTKLPGPPAEPILGCWFWDPCPSAWKGTDPRFP